jgi:pyrroloquinoline-quinone synthase
VYTNNSGHQCEESSKGGGASLLVYILRRLIYFFLMNSTLEMIRSRISSHHVLKHPYYQAWNAGTLPKESLQIYARQYFKHVEAFPRYLSSAHSKTADIRVRQVLLENLIDEERGEENHPELWLRFSEGLGNSRSSTQTEEALPETQELIETFKKLAESSPEEALGALIAYEHQVPEVAATKIKGLKAYYGISDPRTLSFFEVHQKADEYHTQALIEVIETLSAEQKVRMQAAALKASESLWNFLSGICKASGLALENCEMQENTIAQTMNA